MVLAALALADFGQSEHFPVSCCDGRWLRQARVLLALAVPRGANVSTEQWGKV